MVEEERERAGASGRAGGGPSGPGAAETGAPGSDGEREQGGEDQARRSSRQRVSDGLSRALNALAALKDALEESFGEARERGDLSMEKAREAMRDAVEKARDATSDARERFDFVSQSEWEALVRRVEALEERLGLDTRGEDGDGGASAGAGGSRRTDTGD